MTNLAWYSALNAALTYAIERGEKLRSINSRSAVIGDATIKHSEIRAHLHGRAAFLDNSDRLVTYNDPKTGCWYCNGVPCDAPEID